METDELPAQSNGHKMLPNQESGSFDLGLLFLIAIGWLAGNGERGINAHSLI